MATIEFGKYYSMPSGKQIIVISVSETEVTYMVAGYQTPEPLRKHIDEFIVMTN